MNGALVRLFKRPDAQEKIRKIAEVLEEVGATEADIQFAQHVLRHKETIITLLNGIETLAPDVVHEWAKGRG